MHATMHTTSCTSRPATGCAMRMHGPVASRTRSRAPFTACNATRSNVRAASSHEAGPKQMVAAALLALALSSQPSSATAAELAAAPADVASTAAVQAPTPVYFGNGCFWGRQKDFVDAEKALGRSSKDISAVVGYAGGKRTGPGGKVCYYWGGDPRTVYERLGHAEVVQLQLDPSAQANEEQQFRRFANTYFADFRRTSRGSMQRLDPQDAGPGYRNVVGIPGGMSSPLFKILQEANMNGMELRVGEGNDFVDGKAKEDDLLNVVWVVDSDKLPFYRAERYHQFHNGLGKAFSAEYTRKLKLEVEAANKIDPTGCPELPF